MPVLIENARSRRNTEIREPALVSSTSIRWTGQNNRERGSRTEAKPYEKTAPIECGDDGEMRWNGTIYADGSAFSPSVRWMVKGE